MVEKLAMEVGPPVRRSKSLEYHAIADQKEIRAVARAPRSGTWRRGPVVEQYERDLEKYLRVKHALGYQTACHMHVSSSRLYQSLDILKILFMLVYERM